MPTTRKERKQCGSPYFSKPELLSDFFSKLLENVAIASTNQIDMLDDILISIVPTDDRECDQWMLKIRQENLYKL